jgi:hypothetical protein
VELALSIVEGLEMTTRPLVRPIAKTVISNPSAVILSANEDLRVNSVRDLAFRSRQPVEPSLRNSSLIAKPLAQPPGKLLEYECRRGTQNHITENRQPAFDLDIRAVVHFSFVF